MGMCNYFCNVCVEVVLLSQYTLCYCYYVCISISAQFVFLTKCVLAFLGSVSVCV